MFGFFMGSLNLFFGVLVALNGGQTVLAAMSITVGVMCLVLFLKKQINN